MDNITKYLHKVAYKFPKGYPDVSNPEEKARLLEMVNNLIKEDEEEDLKSKLISIINSSDLSDDEIIAYTKSIANRGRKGDLITKLADKGYTADRFKFKDKALEKITKDLDNADLAAYFEYAKNPVSLKSLNPAGKFHEELGLPSDLINAFIDIEPGADQSGSAIGKAELFLSMFFSDIGNTADKIDPETGEVKKAKGDNAWGGVGNLEIKGTGGRLGQQAGRGIDAVPLFKRLVKDLLPEDEAEALIEKHSQYYTMSKSISDLYTQAKANGTPETEIQDAIIKALDEAYWSQGMAKNYFKTEKDFTDLEEITKNLLKLNAESYSEVKGVDAILFVDTKGNNKYIIVKKEDYNDTIDNKKFWTTTNSPTGFQWKNVNPNLEVK